VRCRQHHLVFILLSVYLSIQCSISRKWKTGFAKNSLSSEIRVSYAEISSLSKGFRQFLCEGRRSAMCHLALSINLEVSGGIEGSNQRRYLPMDPRMLVGIWQCHPCCWIDVEETFEQRYQLGY
jgi:hypothetical protein